MNEILLGDCMDLMATLPDKSIDLAIVDPPYGININMNAGRKKNASNKKRKNKKWDKSAPDKKYFDELFRVSVNQIIWGGNYFFLPISGGWIFWDKCVPPGLSFSDGELAWSSIGNTLSKVVIPWSGYVGSDGERIHPTQKPVALYRWILQNYAKPGQLILDTHSGSGSCAIACHLEKFDFIAIEKDPDYHAASVKRLGEVRSQGMLF